MVDVQHVGSTSVEGLVAAPVIDMVAGLSDLQGLNEAATLVEGLNYERVESPGWCEDELVAMLQKPRKGETTHQVLLVRHGGHAWKRLITVRDTLAEDLMKRQRLETVKMEHFQPGCSAEQRYTDAKAAYFAELESTLE